jgi:putative SOS response-associated peptidase YedK
MLTAEPNAGVRSVGHHRMPVLLTGEGQYARWLDPEIVERGPLEDGALTFYRARGAGGSGIQ